MTNKPQTDIFGLVPVDEGEQSQSLLPARGARQLTRRERRIMAEARVQELVQEAYWRKTKVGNEYIAQIHQHTTATFNETAGAIWQMKEAVAGSRELRSYTDTFSHRQIQYLGRHLEAAAVSGAEGILGETRRSLYTERVEPGFWDTLLRRDDDE